MKTQFEKIYVLSLITNKDRQKFIKYQFNKLGIDFEFISTKCLCICQPYYKKIFINNDNKFIPYNDNLFFRLGKYSKIDFFEPKIFQEYTRL